MRPPIIMHARLFGLGTAIAAFVIDQGYKLWMLRVFDIGTRQPVHLGPYFDVILAWNTGISYSLLRADTLVGRDWLLAMTLVATLILGIWLLRARAMLTAGALGLIVGGALGNAYDRFTYGAVADFFHFHVGRFSWYVFNLADVAIVAGAVLLLYESLFMKPKPTGAAANS
jgi:signal peptidase II